MDAPREVVDRARRGDCTAFATLYDATSRPLYLYALAILRRPEDAEDAAHAAYLAAWRRLPALRDAGRFAPWLFRIARNAAHDLRRRGPTPEPLPHDVPAPVLDDAARLTEVLE